MGKKGKVKGPARDEEEGKKAFKISLGKKKKKKKKGRKIELGCQRKKPNRGG